MSRSKLETASWIAGIASAFIALYALLPNAARAPGESTNSASASRVVEHPASSQALLQGGAAPSAKLTETSSPFQFAIAAAKEIRGSTARDTELERLAREAVKRGEFLAAVEAASSILGSMRRDSVAGLIGCHSAWLGKYDIARQAIDVAASSSTKDGLRALISQTATVVPGSGSNEIPCAAP